MESDNGGIIFADLDGTLINSAAREGKTDFVIERKDQREISCVTRKQMLLLPALTNLVPVTTRSVEQYKRIKIDGFNPKYALCSNGGNLIVNGEIDKEWYGRSKLFYEKASKEADRLYAILKSDKHRSFEIRTVDGLFLFTKSESPAETLEKLGEPELCGCYASGEKIYVFPKELTKGNAVERFTEKFGIDKNEIVCAGDSIIDVSMLNKARTAIFTDNIPAEAVTAPEKIIREREGFEEFVTTYFYSRKTGDEADV